MISSGQTAPGPLASSGTQPAADEPLMTLRGAPVEVDARRVVRVVVALAFVTLAVVVVVLSVAGLQRNANITLLRQHGVPVQVTMSGCRGLMGGSGSNVVGYSCDGSFTFEGHRYVETIPGNALHATGSKLVALAVPGHAGLVSTRAAVNGEQASDGVFVLPTILLVLLMVAGAGLVLQQKRSRRRAADVERASC